MRRLLHVVAIACALVLPCLPASAQPSPTAIVERVRVDARRSVDFHAAAFPETVYVGQQTTYQVAVYLTANARSRLRRNPEYIPPELRGLLSYELGTPRRVMPANAPAYEAHVFQRALFPVKAGAVMVESPSLGYALPQSSSYFSREERFVIRAESAQLVVRSLPLEGQPPGFTGAVGVLNTSARIDSLNARVGDPLVLTLRVQGVGNVKLLPRPVVEMDWASAVPGTERVSVDTSGPLVRGAKEFDWILTPTREGPVTFPSISYDYFDPYKAKYAVAVTLPIDLSVRAGVLAAADAGESAALLPLRTPTAPSLAQRGWEIDSSGEQAALLALLLLAPVPAMVLAVRNRKRRPVPVARLPIPAALLRDLAATDGDSPEGARRARRAFHQALAQRLQVTPQSLTSRRQVKRLLRRRGVTRAGTECVLELLNDLDTRGFSSDDVAAAADGERAQALASSAFATRVRECFATVDSEAVQSGGSRFGGLLALLLCAGVAGATVVPAVTIAQTTAAEARASYERRMFTDAEQQFGELVAMQPRDADLLSNWGTASWAAGDTVNAVIAWQRAARLDPLAIDLQERLGMLPSGARGGIAEVPMIPVPLLQAAAIGLWVMAWLIVAGLMVRSRRGRHHDALQSVLVGLAWFGFAGSVTAGGFALWGRRALDASALYVVVRPETMHAAPGADADAMGGVSTGDVVRQLDAQGAWHRVRHADGREGWLPSVRLTAMLPAVSGAREARETGPLPILDSLPAVTR